MKVSQVFLKIYSVVMVCVLFAGFTLMDMVSYEELGAVICLGAVFLFLGYVVLLRHQNVSPQEKIIQDVENPELMPWGGFIYPWFLSFVVSVGLDYFFIERVSPYVLLGSEIIISIFLAYTLLRRLFPELTKYSNRALVIMSIVPLSSVAVALIVAQALVII